MSHLLRVRWCVPDSFGSRRGTESRWGTDTEVGADTEVGVGTEVGQGVKCISVRVCSGTVQRSRRVFVDYICEHPSQLLRGPWERRDGGRR